MGGNNNNNNNTTSKYQCCILEWPQPSGISQIGFNWQTGDSINSRMGRMKMAIKVFINLFNWINVLYTMPLLQQYFFHSIHTFFLLLFFMAIIFFCFIERTTELSLGVLYISLKFEWCRPMYCVCFFYPSINKCFVISVVSVSLLILQHNEYIQNSTELL